MSEAAMPLSISTWRGMVEKRQLIHARHFHFWQSTIVTGHPLQPYFHSFRQCKISSQITISSVYEETRRPVTKESSCFKKRRKWSRNWSLTWMSFHQIVLGPFKQFLLEAFTLIIRDRFSLQRRIGNLCINMTIIIKKKVVKKKFPPDGMK